jgi:hypothetical protein
MTAPPHLRVTHIQRKPQTGNFSVEQIFQNVRSHMPDDIAVALWECPHPSQGVWPRLVNMWQARRHQTGLAHVTGDVHYVTLLMRRPDTMLTILDVVLLHRHSGLPRTVLRWLWFSLPVRRARVITTISEFVRQEVIATTGCAAERVHVVHVPLADRFHATPRPFRTTAPRVLMIGTAWNKNFGRQIAALAGLGCEVDFVGRLSPEHEAAFARGGIPYRTHQDLSDDQMVERYVECDLLLFASTYEGFGMPIVEANAGYRATLVERGFVNARRFTATAVAERYAALYRAMARS